MRKVVLTANDFEMFDTDISSVEYEFFQKHKEAFKRMWIEQGKKFWIQFVMTFRQFAVDYGAIKEFPAKNDQFEDFVDQAFIIIHDNFCDGKFGAARNLIMDIVMVAQNRHTLQYLESKSYAKDPFYNKETRDVFRKLFGQPTEKASYVKVYVLLPIYLKYGGAVCICLRRWLEADDCAIDEFLHTNDKPGVSDITDNKSDAKTGKSSSNTTKDTIQVRDKCKAKTEKPVSSSSSPSSDSTPTSSFQTKKSKTEVISIRNGIMTEEMYDPDKHPDEMTWLNDITGGGNDPTRHIIHIVGSDSTDRENLVNAILSDNPGGPKIQRYSDYQKSLMSDSKEKKNETSTNSKPTTEKKKDEKKDIVVKKESKKEKGKPEPKDKDTSDKSMKSEPGVSDTSLDISSQLFQKNDECFRIYIEEITKGSSSGPTFVKDWPVKIDPRFYDRDNPMYDPKSEKADWKTNMKLGDFEDFIYYVSKHYKNGVKLEKHLVKHNPEEEKQRAIMKAEREQKLSRSRDKTPDLEELKKREQERVAREEVEKRKKLDEERKRQKKIRKKLRKGLPVDKELLTPPTETDASSNKSSSIPDSSQNGGKKMATICMTANFHSNGDQGGQSSENRCEKCHGYKVGASSGCKVHKVVHTHPPHNACASKAHQHPASAKVVTTSTVKTNGNSIHIQTDNPGCKIKIEKKSQGTDPRKPYNMEPKLKDSSGKSIAIKSQETKLLDKRKEMELLIEGQNEPNSVKLTKKFDQKKGTVSLIIEKRDEQGKLTTETHVKPISEDSKLFEEALKTIAPDQTGINVINEKAQEELLKKLAQGNFLSDNSGNGEKSSSSNEKNKNWSHGQDMKEEDKKQFREMYKEISAAIADVARQNHCEEDTKICHANCNHDTRQEKMRNRLRRKIGEKEQDRKNPELPGLLRLGGTLQYPEDEREAMMITLSEMTKMTSRERELFQERLGRTKYFKDCQEDPRDVADSLGACLFPGMKEDMQSVKAKHKKEKIREQESKAEKEKKLKEALKDKVFTHERPMDDSFKDTGLSEEDLKKIVGYKDDVKRMKEELQYNNLKLSNMLEKQKQTKEYIKTGREFEEQVKKASDELKILEQKIAFLDRECAGLDNPEFNASVLKASEELKAVKRKVEKWEMDADILNEKIDKFEQGDDKALLNEEEIDEADKDTHSDTDEAIYEMIRKKGPANQEKAFEDFKTVMGLESFPFEDKADSVENTKVNGKNGLTDKDRKNDDESKSETSKNNKKKKNKKNKLDTRSNNKASGQPEMVQSSDSKKSGSDSGSYSLLNEEAINSFWTSAKLLADSETRNAEKAEENRMQQSSTKPRRKTNKIQVKMMTEKDMKDMNPKGDISYMPDECLPDGLILAKKLITGQDVKVHDNLRQHLNELQAVAQAIESCDQDSMKSKKNKKDGNSVEDPIMDEIMTQRIASCIQTAVEQEIKERENSSSGVKITEIEDDAGVENTGEKKRTLRQCSKCEEFEPAPKTYKKCQKCKLDGIKAARYYCGRDCQVSDWKRRHKQEHADGSLK